MNDWIDFIHAAANVAIFVLIAIIAIVVIGVVFSPYETGKKDEVIDSVTLEKRKINQEILRCIEVTQKPEECKNALMR